MGIVPDMAERGRWPWWIWLAASALATGAIAVAVLWGNHQSGMMRLRAALAAARAAGYGGSLAGFRAGDPDARPERRGTEAALRLIALAQPMPALIRGDWHQQFGLDGHGGVTPEAWRAITASAAARRAWHERRIAGPVLLGGAWAADEVEGDFIAPPTSKAPPFPPLLDLAGCIALAAIAAPDPRADLEDLDAVAAAAIAGRRDDAFPDEERHPALRVEDLAALLRLSLAASGRLGNDGEAAWPEQPIDLIGPYRAAMASRLHRASERDPWRAITAWRPVPDLGVHLPEWVPMAAWAWLETPVSWWAWATGPGHAAAAVRIRLLGGERLGGGERALPGPPAYASELEAPEDQAIDEAQLVIDAILLRAWTRRAWRCAVILACARPPGIALPETDEALRILGRARDRLGCIPGIAYRREGDRTFVLSPDMTGVPTDLGFDPPENVRFDLDEYVARGRPWWLGQAPRP